MKSDDISEQYQADFDGDLMRALTSVYRGDEVETVRARRERVRHRYAECLADLLATRRALKLAQGILRVVEWTQDENSEMHCPSCGNHLASGHESNGCTLEYLLRYPLPIDAPDALPVPERGK
jgi:hypothetical protein